MSQSAVVPEQVCLQQPFELSETVERLRDSLLRPLTSAAHF